MIKKIIKRVLLATSVIVSGTLGFMFTGGKGTVVNDSDFVLNEPIFSIEKANATDGGDCSCGCGCDSIAPPVSSGASWVNIYIDSF